MFYSKLTFKLNNGLFAKGLNAILSYSSISSASLRGKSNHYKSVVVSFISI